MGMRRLVNGCIGDPGSNGEVIDVNGFVVQQEKVSKQEPKRTVKILLLSIYRR
jgi:hypothetical protein